MRAGILLLVVLIGCLTDNDHDGLRTLACLGDSNTEAGWPLPATRRWCEYTDDLAGSQFIFHNLGTGGGVAYCPPGYPPPTYSLLLCADVQLEEALIRTPRPDGIMLAFGTNDLALGTPIETIVAAYQALVARAGAENLQAWIILTPPCSSGGCEDVPALNDALRAAFPPDRLREDQVPVALIGLVHLDDSEQHQRAQVAWNAIK